MTPRWRQSLHDCRVVVGPNQVVALRRNDPVAPVVALVDAATPMDAIQAQLAGADIVISLPAVDETAIGHDAMQLAIRAATTVAHRRNELAATSRSVSHDVAEALNVIGLVTEAGQQAQLSPELAFGHVRELVDDAAEHAWRVGRTHRSHARVVAAEPFHHLFDAFEFGHRAEVTVSGPSAMVLVDKEWLEDALGELVADASRAGAAHVGIAATTFADQEGAHIVVSASGVEASGDDPTFERPGEAKAAMSRRGPGPTIVTEHAEEIGGEFEVIDGGGAGAVARIRLSLPQVEMISTVSQVASPDSSAAAPPSPHYDAPEASILEGVVRHAPLGESLEGIVAAIERRIPGTVCSVLLLQDGRLRHGAGTRLPLAYRDAIDGVAIGVGQGSCGTAAYTGQPVIATDVTMDTNWVAFRALATEHGLRSCWSTPIVAAADGETLGTFAVYTSTVWAPDEQAIRLVNRFTYLAAVAIEHHRLFGALAESEARFRRAFEGAAAGIALASLDGIVLKSNPALIGIVGHERLAGLSLLDFMDADASHLVTESWRQLVADPTGEFAPVEVPLSLRNAAVPKWVSLHTSLIPGESDRQPYLYVEVRDITAARQQMADLRARESAEASNRAKTDFLALASHELRTPLNAILGFAQVMQLMDLDEGQRSEGVNQIVNAGRHLRDLIDQLLDLSRIESGQLGVDMRPIESSEAVREALELVGPLAAARDIELQGELDAADRQTVLADPRCLRQVLINLLDNAVKYTPVGGRVQIAVEYRDGATIRTTVTDSGPGIAHDAFEAIFQPFYRLDQDTDGESVGTGLGLSFCSRLMREMDGTIGVTSTVGEGSAFWIELPAVTDAPSPKVAASATHSSRAPTSPATPSSRAAETGANVLYIEDDSACIEVMSAALRLRPGITLTAARTAAEGSKAISNNHFDLVLLDIALPDRSGLDLLSDIRTTHPSLPVVVLTAGSDSVPSIGREPEWVFVKPVDVTEVLGAIDVMCP